MASRTLTTSEAFTLAASAYNGGRLVEAERICRRIVASTSDCSEAFHLLAIVQSKLGKDSLALINYDRALSLRPKSADIFSDKGLALYNLHRFDDAIKSYNEALALDPNNAAAHYNRGNALQELRRFGEALNSYDHALLVRPDFVKALSGRGNALLALLRLEDALESYDRALAIQPQNFEIYYNRGNAFRELGRLDEAVADYDRAIALKPNFAEAFSNRGSVFKELKRFDDAIESFECALSIRPDYANALYNLGNVLKDLNRPEEALACYDRTLVVDPENAEALSNRGVALNGLMRLEESLLSHDRALDANPERADLHCSRGNTLRKLRRLEDALASYDCALELQPHYVEALSNRGIILKELKRFDEAVASYESALAIQPEYADAHYNEALCLLLTGDFERGWEKHEWRWQAEGMRSHERHFSQPQWRGLDDLADKTILLHAEQGFGDTIQFCRYVPLVAKRAARVILEVQEPLHNLMQTLEGAPQIISRGHPLPDFDMHCPLLSLPLAFGTRINTIPKDVPYLRPLSSLGNEWTMRLAHMDGPKIGLVWSGSQIHDNDLNRSIGLQSMAALLDVRVSFISLQRELRPSDLPELLKSERISHFGDLLRNFSDTAALVSNLDLVISVDTGVAHLAGALGKPVWLFLPYIPDWRWLLDCAHSPWYPTARLFRQNHRRTWETVIANVCAELQQFVCRVT